MNDSFIKYNKIKTGICGFDQMLYDGLVIPSFEEQQGLIIVIKGADGTEKTPFSLQLVRGIANSLLNYNSDMEIFYSSNFLNVDYLQDLELDMFLASAVKRLVSKNLQEHLILKDSFTSFFFKTSKKLLSEYCDEKQNLTIVNASAYDDMICDEALYYNNRTNALHLRKAYGKKHVSNESNAFFGRKCESLSAYIGHPRQKEIENLIDTRIVRSNIYRDDNLWHIVEKLKKTNKENVIPCVNLVDRFSNKISDSDIVDLFRVLNGFKVSIVVLRDGISFPIEDAGMVIDMFSTPQNRNNYLLRYMSIQKSRYQTTVLGRHQYKRRDFGIEVYPSLHLYCQERRYLQRALVYTHSDVISETFQQYLEKHDDSQNEISYDKYLSEKKDISKGYFNALSPNAYKNISIHKALDTIFINPIKQVGGAGDTESNVMKIENDFLYGNNGGITAIIGDPNTYKRYITFGSAFSSAYKKEDTLLLLLNKDSKIARRRLQCPARYNKSCNTLCGECYKYIHFMNIKLGCITPEEFLYYLFQQIETKYHDSEIKRIIIDDLQIVEHCFPFLYNDPLFIPALIDECREKRIALYIMCDKSSNLVDRLRVLADNVVCTDRDRNGNLEIIVERYSGYSAKPSKIFSGLVKNPERLFTCYEQGGRGKRRTIFEMKSKEIGKKQRLSMSDYWIKYFSKR